jgi:hypothetical protein
VLRAYHRHLERDVARAEQRTRTVEPGSPLAHLRGYRVVELRLDGTLPATPTLSDLGLPSSALVLTVRRGPETLEPSQASELRNGDRLTILVPARDEPQVLDALQEGT